MAVPTAMADLSTTANSNSPAGSESPTAGDDFIRALSSILRHTNAKGADIASAATTDLSTSTGEFVDVTGTTTITALGTVAAGIVRTVRFTGALTLTHNATSLILPGSGNITTANGDCAVFRSLGTGNWKCIGYFTQSGSPVSLASPPAIGGTAPAAGAFTTLSSTGNTTLGDAAGDTVTINGTAVSIPNNLNFDSNTLFIDSTNNRIGIGSNNPNNPLQINSGSATYGAIQRWSETNFGNNILGISSGKVHFATDLGNMSWHTNSNMGVDGASVPTNPWLVLNSTGDFTSLGSIGYGTGVGGTVAQGTSKSTGVTLSKICGQITVNGAALAAATIVSFTVTNTLVAGTDVVVINHQSVGTIGAYTVNASAGTGNFVVTIRNNTAGSLSEAIVLNYVVVKGVTA